MQTSGSLFLALDHIPLQFSPFINFRLYSVFTKLFVSSLYHQLKPFQHNLPTLDRIIRLYDRNMLWAQTIYCTDTNNSHRTLREETRFDSGEEFGSMKRE